jgi:hypothetical protein
MYQMLGVCFFQENGELTWVVALNMDLSFATIPYPPPSTENFKFFREKERKVPHRRS